MAKQNFTGLVISQGKMAKTVKVRVQTKSYDKRVHKEVIKRKDYLVHDEGNLCKEGDVVRIEAIPKISSRKYFAIAEIKINKGQKFALYESMAKEKVAQEEKEKIQQFAEKKSEIQGLITQVEDLRKLDSIVSKFQSDPATDREFLLDEINKIKKKYNIKSWPSPEPVIKLELNEEQKDFTVLENRVQNIKLIVEKLMYPEYTQQREEILKKLTSTPPHELKSYTQKNVLRKYILDPRNECPVTF